MAQTTVQYDSGNTTNSGIFPSLSGCCWGNLFTGLVPSATISKVTFYVSSNPGVNIIHFRENGNDPVDDFSTVYNSGGFLPGWKVKTLAANFVFAGTDVFVGLNAYNTNGMPLDTVEFNGRGFHAWRASTVGMPITFGGNPANYLLRITGPGDLPVELQFFSVD